MFLLINCKQLAESFIMDQKKLDEVKLWTETYLAEQKLQDDFKQWTKTYLGRIRFASELDNYVAERDKWILSDNKHANESLKCVLQARALEDCKDRLLKTCQVCGRMFETAVACTRHMNSHMGGIYRCDCGKSFNYVGSLSRHRKTCGSLLSLDFRANIDGPL